jgi:hypothetical protein
MQMGINMYYFGCISSLRSKSEWRDMAHEHCYIEVF